MKVFALVLMLATGPSGGVSISATLRFTSKEACVVAATAILDNRQRVGGGVLAVCIDVTP